MDSANDIEIRSEEVQEILGTPPSWIVRWGTTLAFLTIGTLFWVGYLVRYPDVVKGRVKVTSTEPPRRLIAENTTYISEILVENEDTVQNGQILMVFKSKAKFEDVLVLEDHILSLREMSDSAMLAFGPPDDLLLGELQQDLYDFYQSQEEFNFAASGKFGKLSIRQLRKQIRKLESGIKNDRNRQTKLNEQLELINQRFVRQQNLYNEKVITISTLRKTKEDILALEREMQGIESTIKTKQFQIETIKDKINGVKRGSSEDVALASSKLKDNFVQLQNKVEDWKKQYLVSSPIKGIVLFTNENIGEQQFVSRETELLQVIPVEERETIGRMYLSTSGSGKVKKGQQVIVKFDSHPFYEFGAVKGIVSKKGRILKEGRITIEILFPNGLKTNRGKPIETGQEMEGEAEIITKDKRFLERVFEQVVVLFG